MSGINEENPYRSDFELQNNENMPKEAEQHSLLAADIDGGRMSLTEAQQRPRLSPGKQQVSEMDKGALELELADYRGQVAAISKSQAVIEFGLDGTIITANTNFLNALGYTLDEIKGQHHRMFVEAEEAGSVAYANFWAALNRGEYQAGEYKRLGKNGREVWIQASYNPILDTDGKPFKVVKYATDVTERKMNDADFRGQLEAISKSQAVIEFNLDGTIVTANDNFLNALGYTLNEIKGKHHSMFADPAEANSVEYANFWSALRRGDYQAGEFRRIGKGGREVWIQASYNPILDNNGKPFKVVKFATDITEQVAARKRLTDGVNEVLAVIGAAVGGDLTQEVLTEGDDAVGQVAQGLRNLLDTLRGSIAGIAEVTSSLSMASDTVAEVSTEMSNTAQETSAQSTVAAAAAEEVAASIATVAAATDEMTASISEISRSSATAAETANQGVQAADNASRMVDNLNKSSVEIGSFLAIISSIAEQTNLLALNATIEAARAGEVGKGFAVVASEVKDLAKGTAKATEEISQKVEAIQADTAAAIEAIKQITMIINEISSLQVSVASAVEQQAATTNEIGRNVNEVSMGTTEIAQNVASVAGSASTTLSGANQTLESATELARMAQRIDELVSGFKY